MNNTMFSDEERDIRFGTYKQKVNFEKYEHLREVEKFFLEEMKKYPTNTCYDLGALQHPYFDTVNYTNYSDFFMMRPLQPDLSHIQVDEALIYGENHFKVDFFNIYSDKLKKENVNKYKTAGKHVKNIEAVVVLIGNNKLDNMCFNKLKHIYNTYGKLAIFKPHPLVDGDMTDFFQKGIHKHANVANKESDVYEYIKDASIVYTTHWSETAFHSLCLGKKIDPIDTFQSKFFGSFSHINKHFFETNNPEYVINKMFNDYRSGLVNPKYQDDWEERISKYLKYIHEKRKDYRYKYVQSHF